ncbi:MAG TPA: sigma-70 region 4 domain-containing protein [Nocardioides sp.]|uniref:sigma-70 region 4 domain-containing protein n=1 Tax=Nocardioides sp. TaxID=35761 RepID=UPI002F3EFEC9
MKAAYDEWAVARTPSLLAFAAALVDDHDAADAAVTRALSRMRGAWARVSRDDPDLEARRHVVRACSTPRRAAVVLRLLEERSDAEIAGVLHCSESAARRYLQRGLTEVHEDAAAASRAGSAAGSATDPAGLREHVVTRAGSAPTQLLTRQPPPTRAAVTRRRSRGPWLTVLAVLVLVGGVAYVAHESRTPGGVFRYSRVDVPESWRYESYAGVQLQVPDTWGWGGSPIRATHFGGPKHLGSCGTSQASVLSPADSSPYVTPETGFVGRPAILTQRCMTLGSAGTMPSGYAVWFDSPLPVGEKGLGPTVAETRAVGDQHVTVFAPQPSLRRQILGTVEQVRVDHHGCPTAAVVRPSAGPRPPEPDSLSVCVYSQDTGVSTLMYSTAFPADAARRYAAQEAAASTAGVSCATPSGRWVALGLTGDDDTSWDVVNPGCGRIESAGGRSAELTPETVRDWAVGGVTAYVSPPAHGDPALDRYFRTPTA